jgi:hypothetical protein
VAQVAIHGINLAANFKALQQTINSFDNNGSMAIIGKKA